MTREIKFRAWHKWRNEMCSVRAIHFGTRMGMGPDDRVDLIELHNKTEAYRNGEDVEPMQYTGFKDCKEREIYEDDIILYVNKKYRIVFDEGAWILQDSKSYEEDDYIMLWNMHQWAEVVGNAHEHPELLENKK